jgi:hypothetical protein
VDQVREIGFASQSGFVAVHWFDAFWLEVIVETLDAAAQPTACVLELFALKHSQAPFFPP